MYGLTTGMPVTSLSSFSSPLDEYKAAFEDQAFPFLNYYTFADQQITRQTLTRGEFWDLAFSAASYLVGQNLSKGDRIIHCFSSNNLYDLVFRLATVLVGCVPVTINWQADDDDTIIYKARITDARLLIYDEDFADRIDKLKPELLPMQSVEAGEFQSYRPNHPFNYPELNYDDERMVIFTSGTTGKPKGVSLSHRSYLANRYTFEQYFGMSGTTQMDLLLVNPLHHANSSALFDWGMRRGGTIIHLLSRYTTAFWEILIEGASQKRDLFVTSVVSRHIDFLESLSTESKLPVEQARLREALHETHVLIGSAPVGPTTIERILSFSNRLPHVRFGSTETCLQVMATPITLSQDELMEAFKAGWVHRHDGEETVGYYIGREHYPFTRVKVVKSVDPESKEYFCPCEIGEPGYLITQGPNLMSGYVGDTGTTQNVFREEWYCGLRDITFALKNKTDGQLDYYWVSRDSTLLIRGGANYAYDQVAAELSRFLMEHFDINPKHFFLAVVGLRLHSEHEDSCCVTIELNEDAASAESRLRAEFIEEARQIVSKAARPDYLQVGRIPRNFKGAVIYPELQRQFRDSLENKQRSVQ